MKSAQVCQATELLGESVQMPEVPTVLPFTTRTRSRNGCCLLCIHCLCMQSAHAPRRVRRQRKLLLPHCVRHVRRRGRDRHQEAHVRWLARARAQHSATASMAMTMATRMQSAGGALGPNAHAWPTTTAQSTMPVRFEPLSPHSCACSELALVSSACSADVPNTHSAWQCIAHHFCHQQCARTQADAWQHVPEVRMVNLM